MDINKYKNSNTSTMDIYSTMNISKQTNKQTVTPGSANAGN
jgi:hypothetical protein